MKRINVKITIDGAEETIKLLDEASSLIDKLREVVNELLATEHIATEFTDSETVTDEDH